MGDSLRPRSKDSTSVPSSDHSQPCHPKRLKPSEISSLSQPASTPSTSGQAASTPSEIKPDAVPAGLSPPLRSSLTEPASKVVTTLSSPHKIWSLVIAPTTVAKVVTSTKLGTTSIKLVSLLTLATHTPLVLVLKVLATALAPDLVPGRSTTLKVTAPSETSMPSSRRSTPTVQSKLVSS